MSGVRTLPRLLASDRLRLAAGTPDDAADQAAAVNASLAELQPWLPWAQQPQTDADARGNLTEVAANFDAGNAFDWVIREAGSKEFVGRIGLFAIDWAVPKGEIGYWIRSGAAGRGYAREAARLVVEAAHGAGFRRLEIRCDSRNAASARVAEALGFTQDAVFGNDGVAADDPARLVATRVFSLTR